MSESEKRDWEFRVCGQGEIKDRTWLLTFCYLLPAEVVVIVMVPGGSIRNIANAMAEIILRNLLKFSCFCQILVVGGDSFPAWMPVRVLLFVLEWIKSISPLIGLFICVYHAPVSCWAAWGTR